MVEEIKSISIIVCFYNAGEKLIPTIEHLMAIEIPMSVTVELILVNNNSNDNSCQLIEQTLSSFNGFPWRIVDELNPGLTNARYKGLYESKSDLLLFCDDDNWLDSDYLIEGLKYIHSDKNIAVVGGIGYPISTISIPKWFENEQNFFACGPQSISNGIVRSSRNVVYGAGMFIKKKYWMQLIKSGFTPISSDRKGKELSSGGDSELCLALQIAGMEVHFYNNLKFKHYISSDRLTQEYKKKLKKGMATSRFVTRFYLDYLNGWSPKVGKNFWVKELLYTIRNLPRDILKLDTNEVDRKINFIRFLLRTRKKYDDAVLGIINICNKLEALKSE